nr:MAG: replication initiation protein [Microvirus sp.]
MGCHKPIYGYKTKSGQVGFSEAGFAQAASPKFPLPCGRCTGCRLARSLEHSIRCMHEAQTHTENTAVTLTYDNHHLPPNGELNHKDFQIFIRALRDRTHLRLRYFMCGEYGEKNNRPHFHAILFGYEFPDKYKWRFRRGKTDYRSNILDKVWARGHAEIMPVTRQTTQYIARYIMKKQSADLNFENQPHHVDPETGEIKAKQQEYVKMSLKPGLGAAWLEKYEKDIFPADTCIIEDGKKVPVPKYYRTLMQRKYPVHADILARKRTENAINHVDPDGTSERLATRDKIAQIRAKKLKREL